MLVPTSPLLVFDSPLPILASQLLVHCWPSLAETVCMGFNTWPTQAAWQCMSFKLSPIYLASPEIRRRCWFAKCRWQRGTSKQLWLEVLKIEMLLRSIALWVEVINIDRHSFGSYAARESSAWKLWRSTAFVFENLKTNKLLIGKPSRSKSSLVENIMTNIFCS